jgi:hypothetical protein
MESIRKQSLTQVAIREGSSVVIETTITIDRVVEDYPRKRGEIEAAMDIAVTSPDLSNPLHNQITITVTVYKPTVPPPTVSAWLTDSDQNKYDGTPGGHRKGRKEGKSFLPTTINFSFDPVPTNSYVLTARAVGGTQTAERNYSVIVAS